MFDPLRAAAREGEKAWERMGVCIAIPVGSSMLYFVCVGILFK